MKNKKNFILLYIGLALLGVFVVWALLVYFHVFDNMDKKIIHFIYELRGSHSEPRGLFFWINRIVTELGYVYVLVPVCVITLVIFKGDLKSLFLGISTLGNWAINKGVKGIINRPRPDIMYHMMEETSESFPSGHAMSAAGCYFFAAYLVLTSDLKAKTKKILASVLIAIPVIIAITRICLSVHYLTDVIGGLIFGGAMVFIFAFVYELLKSKGYNGIKALLHKNK